MISAEGTVNTEVGGGTFQGGDLRRVGDLKAFGQGKSRCVYSSPDVPVDDLGGRKGRDGWHSAKNRATSW